MITEEDQEALSKMLEQPKEKRELPPIWNIREQGSKIVGIVKELIYGMPVKSEYSETADVVVIETLEGEKSIFLPFVLKNEMQRMNIQSGDKIGIECLGKPVGKQYYDFKIVKL